MNLMRTHDDSKEACVYRLKLARMAAGLTKSQFAAEAGIKLATYGHQETGLVNPSRQVMKTLYRSYGIDYNFIFEGDFTHLPPDLQSRLFAAAAAVASRSDQESD